MDLGRAYLKYSAYSLTLSELLYYNKGNEEWGEPIMILGQNQVRHQSPLVIYPNPVFH